MRRVIFVVGPPGAGKTAFCDELIRLFNSSEFPPARFSDGDTLRQMREEKERGTDCNAILLNDADRKDLYRRLAERVINEDDALALVEMSPNDPAMAFQFYSQDILKRSLLIQMASTLQQCLHRNKLRAEQNPDTFNAFIPEEYVARFFPRYARKLRTVDAGRRVIVRNNRAGIGTLAAKAAKLFEEITRA